MKSKEEFAVFVVQAAMCMAQEGIVWYRIIDDGKIRSDGIFSSEEESQKRDSSVEELLSLALGEVGIKGSKDETVAIDLSKIEGQYIACVSVEKPVAGVADVADVEIVEKLIFTL